jgi:hypothetical protein
VNAETLRKLTWSRLSICTICRHLALQSFLMHGRSNADLASTIAFDCCLTLLAIFALVLPTIKKMLKRVKPASRADQSQDDELSTISWIGQHPSSSVSSSVGPSRSSLPRPKTLPSRPARSLFPCLLAPLPPAQMRPHPYGQKASPYDRWEAGSVSASTTMTSLCEMQSFGSKEGILDAQQKFRKKVAH